MAQVFLWGASVVAVAAIIVVCRLRRREPRPSVAIIVLAGS